MPELTGNEPEDTYIFMLLILRAFHDDAAFFYDAWEEGFAGAAATAVQVQPGVSPDFDPKDPGPFYALSVYESENHPSLGNSTFYPQGDFGGMFVWRVAMDRAAWTKCWIEDNQFFANFNTQYYAQFDAALPGDVLGLRAVAAGVLPSVEGLPFQEWYQRQYVLDTSVRSGLKEYTWNIPLDSAVVLITEHYLTDDVGDEYVRGGQGRAIYWSYDFAVNLYAEEGYLIDVPTTGSTPGEGFLIPTFFNIGGPQRITVQIDLNGLRSYYPFPYGVRGFDPGENNLYGGIINATTGEIDVDGGDGITDLSVGRGVWGSIIKSPELSPLKLEVTYTNPDGDLVVRRVNVGWDSYVMYIDGGTQTTLNHTFSVGVTGLHLVSLPITPVDGSAPSALGIDTGDLLLARWDPAVPPLGVYRIWPDCDPIAYGRGYWLRILNDVTLSIAGIQAPTEERISIPLELGWNMFGSVRLSAMAVADLKIQIGTDTPILIDDAIDAHAVQKGIFGYTQTAGYATTDELLPYQGYWIRCLLPAGCQLVFEPVNTASVADAEEAPAAADEPDWKLPIHVQCGAFASGAAYLGADAEASDGCDEAYDLQAPPTFGPYVAARFSLPDGGVYLSDVRGANVEGQSWNLTVTSTIPDQPVRVTWPDLSQTRSDIKPILVDPQTGKRLYMRTTPGYTIAAGTAQTGYPLRVEVPTANAGSLTVSALSAATGTSNVTVAYSLSQTAAVSARVMNIAGRLIRTLATDRVQAAGVNSVAWNLADNTGLKVPSGLYLVEVRARSEEGQDVRAIRTVQVNRR